ncbi:hypothetical protein TrVFT333_000115 [Trichoderma virens FT-333]|nr:hypothetical protein TrVFT333_000115 [Trichoderma virens FT-333]
MVTNLLNYPNLAPNATAYGADAAGLVDIIKSMSDGQDKRNLQQAFVDLGSVLRTCWYWASLESAQPRV